MIGIACGLDLRALILQSSFAATSSEVDYSQFKAPPVAKEQTHESTTGDVNIYADPETFGTRTPRIYVDCKGIDGSTPLAAVHQDTWMTEGTKSYRISSNHAKKMVNRKWAVKILYPNYAYIFSAVVCHITKEQKSFTKILNDLVKWAKSAARTPINQYSLPALLVILNQPSAGSPSWLTEDSKALEKMFFEVVERQMTEGTSAGKSLAKEVRPRNPALADQY